MTFLPENYKIPQVGGLFTKLQQGDNKFLILDKPEMGFEYWTTDTKPVRSKTPFKSTPNIKTSDNGKQEVKYFWAFPIFDYASKEVKILELTQKSIIQTITDYSNNSDWGNPVMKYSFSVKKSGTGFDTEYTVMANPAGTLPEGVETAWKDKKEEVTKTISEMFSVAGKTDAKTAGVEYPEEEINPDEIPF